MNLADRFFRVVKANINSVLQNLEDPEKILEQAVEDMQKDLIKIRQSYAEVSATQKRFVHLHAGTAPLHVSHGIKICGGLLFPDVLVLYYIAASGWRGRRVRLTILPTSGTRGHN